MNMILIMILGAGLLVLYYSLVRANYYRKLYKLYKMHYEELTKINEDLIKLSEELIEEAKSTSVETIETVKK